jgi:hypothetical protein
VDTENACARGIVADYLESGALPDEAVTC